MQTMFWYDFVYALNVLEILLLYQSDQLFKFFQLRGQLLIKLSGALSAFYFIDFNICLQGLLATIVIST